MRLLANSPGVVGIAEKDIDGRIQIRARTDALCSEDCASVDRSARTRMLRWGLIFEDELFGDELWV